MMHNVREISRQMQMASIARIQQIFAGDVTNQFKNAVRRNDEARINELITQKTSLVRDKFSNDTFLHIVAKDGTPEAAIRLLQLGSDVHARNLEGKTPIFYALKHSAPMIRAFLNNAEIIQKNNYTLLLDALVIGSEEIVGVILNKCLIKIAEYSLQNVISPTRLQSDFCEFQNTEDLINSILRNRFQLFLEEQDYVPFIFFVAKIGRTDILQLILNECRVVLNAKGKNKVTPLHLAVIAQLPEVVLFLLENGANPNCQIQKQITPLHIAAFLQNEEICELLLNFRADCNIGSFDIGYPLHLVCGSNYGQVLKKRLNQTFLNMFDSCKTFDEKTINRTIMKLLLENGANPEFQSRYLELPLLYACRCDRLEEVKLLLEFGANVRAVDSQGNSALHHACIGNAFEIVRMLLEQGVDIETKNQRNHTPFVFSLNSSLNLKMLEFLVDNGANVNAEFSSGLYEALRCSSPDVVEYLLELGADYSILNKKFVDVEVREIAKHKLFISYITLYKNESLKNIQRFYDENDCEMQKKIIDHFDKCKCEITKLKMTKISEELTISYFDFLTRNFYSTVQIFNNTKLRKILSFKTANSELKNEFPCYNYLLRKRFERVKSLEIFVNKSSDFIYHCGTLKVPILVTEKILGNLSSHDFRVLGTSLSNESF